jgi:hypothetical protein
LDPALIANPPILAFGASVAAGLSRLRINIPAVVFTVVSGYLLVAIGLKGGAALATSAGSEAFGAIGVAIAISAVTPLILYPVLRRWVNLDQNNAAALAAHYGSISIVTFTVASSFLERAGFDMPPYAVAMAAAMELPAILTAFAMAGGTKSFRKLLNTGVEVLTGRASVLLTLGLVIGMVLGESQAIGIVATPFNLMLTVFLGLMGMKVASRLGDLRTHGLRLTLFALFAPLAMGSLTVVLASALGLEVAAVTLLGTLAASASYIAAPAAVAKAIPQASPAVYLAPPLAVSFPFNVFVGILIYHQIAVAIAS